METLDEQKSERLAKLHRTPRSGKRRVGRPLSPKNRLVYIEDLIASGYAKIWDGFTAPEADKAQKIRAQGIVNMRLRCGWFKRPKWCCLCGPGKTPDRLIAHHQDYGKPLEVWWVCDAHHFAVHRKPSLLSRIKPFICDRKILPLSLSHPERRGR